MEANTFFWPSDFFTGLLRGGCLNKPRNARHDVFLPSFVFETLLHKRRNCLQVHVADSRFVA
jgi:hypothetical protein